MDRGIHTIHIPASCNEFATERPHFGLVYGRPHAETLFDRGSQSAIPVLVRVETPDVNMLPDAARQALTQQLEAFLTAVSLNDLIKPYQMNNR